MLGGKNSEKQDFTGYRNCFGVVCGKLSGGCILEY